LADGTLIDPKDVVVQADGSLTTKDGKPLEGVRVTMVEPLGLEGATLRPDGKWVLADGTLMDPRDVVIHADGSLTTKDGKPLEGVRVAVQPLEGATLRPDGKWALADGTLIDPKDVVVHPDGSLTTKDGKPLEGVRVKTGANAQVIEGLSADFSKAKASARPGAGPLYEIDYIIGGASKDGVAPVQKLPVMKFGK
jgi:pilus assembly protein CpaB